MAQIIYFVSIHKTREFGVTAITPMSAKRKRKSVVHYIKSAIKGIPCVVGMILEGHKAVRSLHSMLFKTCGAREHSGPRSKAGRQSLLMLTKNEWYHGITNSSRRTRTSMSVC